jgi:hypothetical protein
MSDKRSFERNDIIHDMEVSSILWNKEHLNLQF